MKNMEFKKVMLTALLLQIACMMCACQQGAKKTPDLKETNETSYQVTQKPAKEDEQDEIIISEETPDTPTTSETANAEISLEELEEGKTLNTDLDGDGQDELISYELWEEPEYGDIFQATIKIDGEEIKSDYGFFDTRLLIVRFMSDDSAILLLSDYGMSDDYATEYYKYENGKIMHLGTTEGVVFNDTLKLNPDKSLIANTRASIVQTWWYEKTFFIRDDFLEEKQQDFYDIAPCDFYTFASETLCDYDFYLTPDLSSSRVTIPMGAYVTFTKIDDVNWTEITYEEYDEEKVAYFYVEEFWSLDGNPEFTCEMLFKDLLLAD